MKSPTQAAGQATTNQPGNPFLTDVQTVRMRVRLRTRRRSRSTPTRLRSESFNSAASPTSTPAILTSRSRAEYGEGRNLRDMILENLVAERIAIESYREMIAWLHGKDSTTHQMLEGILAMEEEHADDMASLLKGMGG